MPLSYVLINVEPGSEEEIMRAMIQIPNVKECHRLYGRFDMIARVEAESVDKVKQVVTLTIGRIQGVRFTTTTIVVE